MTTITASLATCAASISAGGSMPDLFTGLAVATTAETRIHPMSNDYKRPPVPQGDCEHNSTIARGVSFLTHSKGQLLAYGDACAEAARAPLAEENARLKDRLRSVCRALVAAVGADGPCDAEDASARAVARIAELEGDRDRVQKGLLDPHTVHINMLRGTIAWIGWRRACHITGDVPNGEDYQLSEIVRLRAEVEALRAERDALAEPCSRLVAMDFGADGWCAQCEAQAKGIRDALRAITARKGEGSEG